MNIDFKEHKKYKNQVFKTKEEIELELKSKGINKIYHVLSFGGGTQSTHLLEDHFKKMIHYDYIIMSDTGAEPGFIHKQVAYWKNRQNLYNNTTPFIVTNHSSMRKGLEEMLFRYIYTNYQRFQLPVYCSKKVDGKEVKAGIMKRQCTIDFKILPVKQKIRQLILKELGLSPRKRMHKDIGIIIDLGFSVDEIKRISTYKSPQFKYMYLAYPLVERNLTTDASINFLSENNMPTKRSRCYLCPFNCDMKGMDWKEIIEEEPLSFLKACWIDEKLREVQASNTKNMNSIPYFHYSRVALKDVYKNEHKELINKHQIELLMWIDSLRKYISYKYNDNKAIETNDIEQINLFNSA